VIAAGFQVSTGFQLMLMLVFDPIPPFSTSFLWPNRYSTDYICSFNWFSNGFQHWFVGSFNRLSTGGFQQVVLAVFQQVFNWLRLLGSGVFT